MRRVTAARAGSGVRRGRRVLTFSMPTYRPSAANRHWATPSSMPRGDSTSWKPGDAARRCRGTSLSQRPPRAGLRSTENTGSWWRRVSM
ncbi:hypothetical protein QR97_37815 [Streptomyces sp. PBH53]|nr:hypothetical protein QR97_37815 [Streptomyces sp. PBH53]